MNVGILGISELKWTRMGEFIQACCPSFLPETGRGSQEGPPNKPVSQGFVVAGGPAGLASPMEGVWPQACVILPCFVCRWNP